MSSVETEDEATEEKSSERSLHSIHEELDKEIRVIVRDLEQKGREMLTILPSIHQIIGLDSVSTLCDEVTNKFVDIRSGYSTLSSKLPPDQYYRFNDHWRFITQRLCSLAALVHYLRTDELLTRQQCADILGVQVERSGRFHLDIEDFLSGILQLAIELSRLAVNSVTSSDYDRPIIFARFIDNLDLGFRLLSLKNDSLRKRFGELKNDIKKVEEVVYDVTIRGLRPA